MVEQGFTPLLPCFIVSSEFVGIRNVLYLLLGGYLGGFVTYGCELTVVV